MGSALTHMVPSSQIRKWRYETPLCGFGRADVLFFVIFPPPLSCFGVPSSQMDAVRQPNDACFPSLALAAAAVYMPSRRQTSCKTRVLIYVGVLCNYTNITLLTAHINTPTTCNERHFIGGELMLSISADRMLEYLILLQYSEKMESACHFFNEKII